MPSRASDAQLKTEGGIAVGQWMMEDTGGGSGLFVSIVFHAEWHHLQKGQGKGEKLFV